MEQLTSREEFESRSLKQLMRDLSHDSSTLMRQEGELLKKELDGKIDKAKREVTTLGTGGVIAFVGLLVLTAALVLMLRHVMPDWAAALVVGAVYVIGGLALFMKGKKELGEGTMKPETTMNSMKQDVRMVREAMHRG